MSVTNDAVMERWQYHVRHNAPMTGQHGRELSTNGRNILSHGDVLYSYGTHFTLAQVNRDAKGRPVCLLLNGDRFSNTTSQHQAATRTACAWLSRDLDIPVIIVPFTALSAAGVNPRDVEPIDVRADRHITHRHSSPEKPGERHVDMDDPAGRTTTAKRWDYQVSPAVYRDVEVPLRVPNPDAVYVGRSSWLTAERGADGVWRWERQQHLLGDSIFKARVRETVSVTPSPEQRELFALLTRLANERQSLSNQIDALKPPFHHRRWDARAGRYETWRCKPRDWREITRQAWTEAALREQRVKADATWSAAYDAAERSIRPGHRFSGGSAWRISRQRTRYPIFLSSFDYQEAQPLYFLCELPASARGVTTVEEAIEALKPPEVVAAEARGISVTRQGDLFAIPTRLSKRQLRRLRNERHDFTKKLRILGTNHSVTEGVICRGGAVFGRGIMRHEPDAWRQPDHARQRMGDGKTWHLLVRNTVPRQ